MVGKLLSIAMLSAVLGPAPAPPADSVVVRADRKTADLSRGLVFAEGHVLVAAGDFWLTADAATYDEEAQTVRATGQVRISTPDRLVTGSEAVYDIANGRGEVADVDGWDESPGIRLYVSGSKLIFEEGKWTLANAFIRSSGREDASYRLRASTLTYVPADAWYGHDVEIEVFGLRVLRTGYYEQKVDDPTLTSLQWVPSPGISPMDGVYAEWAYERDIGGDFRLRTAARLSTLVGLSGGARISKRIGDRGSVWGRFGYREGAGDQVRPYLRLDRTEVGANWRLTDPGAKWRLDAQASWGVSREYPSRARAPRKALVLTGQSPTYDIGESTTGRLMGGTKLIGYSPGVTYTDTWIGGQVSHRFSRDWRLSARLTRHFTTGTSPLETDRAEIPFEARLGGRIRLTNRIAAEAEVWYDIEQARVRHTETSLRYRSADFVYRLRYNVERQFLMFDLLLPDL